MPKMPESYRWGMKPHTNGNGVAHRDSTEEQLNQRILNLDSLFGLIVPAPKEWVGDPKNKDKTEIECLPCTKWVVLVKAWQGAMTWTEGLDRALSVMLACITSTKSAGDQLWCKPMGPPSTGKSTLCEALSVNRKHIVAKSTIRGFHSGFKVEGKGDSGLIATLKDRTLIIKDGDTLMKAPNVEQILSEARDIYDRASRTSYRNGVAKEYLNWSMTMILCGTSALRKLDQSELGDRFLDVVIMEGIDDALEDEVLMMVADRADRISSLDSGDHKGANQDPKLLLAMQLTGGYVNHLRDNAKDLLREVIISTEDKRRCTHLGKFVAYMRARPSLKQEEVAEREFGSRLVSQLVRLAKCLAVVMNKKTTDKEVMRRVTRVALDTARGRTLDLVKILQQAGDEGMTLYSLSIRTDWGEDKNRVLLRFLRTLGAVERWERPSLKGMKTTSKWRLTTKMAALCDKVMTDQQFTTNS